LTWGRAGEEFEQASGDDAHATAHPGRASTVPDGRSSRSDPVPAPNTMPVEIFAADLLFPSSRTPRYVIGELG
jgi:hypothetical protein